MGWQRLRNRLRAWGRGETGVALRRSVLLTLQTALVGEVTPEMRFISVEWSPTEIHIWVYVDGSIDEAVTEEFDAMVITEMVATFAYPDQGDPVVRYDMIRCDYPERPNIGGRLVYGRKEPYP